MNIKRIISFLKLREQLSEDELAMAGVLAGLTENERDLLVESLQPQKVAGKRVAAQRKIEHCSACNHTKRAAVHKDMSLKDYHEFQSLKPKSARAASLAEQIKKTQGLPAGCTAILSSNSEPCGAFEDNALHHDKGYVDYHPFSPPAHPAAGSSSARSGAGSSTVGTEDGMESASTAAGTGG
jgi:hypothetical protein